MLAEKLLAFRRILEDENVILCYCGIVTEQILLGVGNSLKSKLAIEQADKNKAKALFAVFVEQMQNVIRYSVERTGNVSDLKGLQLAHGLVTVGKTGSVYYVACANLVRRRDVNRLSASLNQIRNMGKEELKALYKQTLKGDAPDESQGAGVGFIDIARKCSQSFDFDFLDIDDDHVFFALKAYV